MDLRLTHASRTTVASLPPELLAIVFKYVYAEQMVAHQLNLEPDDRSLVEDLPESEEEFFGIDDLRDAVREPTYFPYALAAVSPFWEEILSSTPAFWDRIVLFADSQPTSIDKALKYFEWSRNRPIDVFITQKPSSAQSHHTSEASHVHRLVGYLVPHLHRCRSLHIDVERNTSLPVLPTYLPCETPLLESINFSCWEDLAVYDSRYRVHLFSRELSIYDQVFPFKFQPPLRKLAIDGRNFQHAFLDQKPWISQLDQLQQLTVSYYAPYTVYPGYEEEEDHACSQCRLPLEWFLQQVASFRSLQSLKLSDIMFDISTTDPAPTPYDLCQLHALTFENIMPSVIQALFKICVFESTENLLQTVTFVRCPYLHQVILPTVAPALALGCLDKDVDIAEFIKPWTGQILSIYSCPGLGDDFFDMLCTRVDGSDEGSNSEFVCEYMVFLDLHFSHLPCFSVDSVRKMVSARTSGVDYTDSNWRNNTTWGPAPHRLRFRGKLPELSSEDEEWFRARVANFDWIIE